MTDELTQLAPSLDGEGWDEANEQKSIHCHRSRSEAISQMIAQRLTADDRPTT